MSDRPDDMLHEVIYGCGFTRSMTGPPFVAICLCGWQGEAETPEELQALQIAHAKDHDFS